MKQHKKILDFIKVIRGSFHDSCIVYSYGGCYGFYKILKHTFPTAKPYTQIITLKQKKIDDRIKAFSLRYYFRFIQTQKTPSPGSSILTQMALRTLRACPPEHSCA